MTDPIYAIPDIHGHDALLDEALDRIARDGGPEARVVFLGDLVDRGPNSRAVIERLLQGQRQGRPWTVLRGNHDQMFLDFLDRGVVHASRVASGLPWLHPRLGGAMTLASYGITAPDPDQAHAEARTAVPRAHRDWLAGLPCWHADGPRLFVHAGIRPGVALDAQDPDDLMWIRAPFLDHAGPHPWLVVHGHTALHHPTHFGNRIDLDGGAGFDRPLWPAVFEGTDCWLLDDTGRAALAPGG